MASVGFVWVGGPDLDQQLLRELIALGSPIAENIEALTYLEPFASGMYVNVMSDEGASGLARAYPPAKLARLRAFKAAYDPDNVFHLNQNIQPA